METAKKSHRQRKNPRSRELWQEAKAAKNAARGKQVWVPSSFQGTIADLDKMSDAEILAIVPAHWERV